MYVLAAVGVPIIVSIPSAAVIVRPPANVRLLIVELSYTISIGVID